jgi:hypothetical protein
MATIPTMPASVPGNSRNRFTGSARLFPVPEIVRLVVYTGERIDQVPLDWHAASGTVLGHVRFVPLPARVFQPAQIARDSPVYRALRC